MVPLRAIVTNGICSRLAESSTCPIIWASVLFFLSSSGPVAAEAETGISKNKMMGYKINGKPGAESVRRQDFAQAPRDCKEFEICFIKVDSYKFVGMGPL